MLFIERDRAKKVNKADTAICSAYPCRNVAISTRGGRDDGALTSIIQKPLMFCGFS